MFGCWFQRCLLSIRRSRDDHVGFEDLFLWAVSSTTNQISNGVLQGYNGKTCDDVLLYIKMRAKQHFRVPESVNQHCCWFLSILTSNIYTLTIFQWVRLISCAPAAFFFVKNSIAKVPASLLPHHTKMATKSLLRAQAWLMGKSLPKLGLVNTTLRMTKKFIIVYHCLKVLT